MRRTINAILVPLFPFLVWLMARADTTGYRLRRGRSFVSGSTGGRAGDVEALGVPATITANGQTSWFDGTDVSTVLGVLTVGGPVTGTAPTLDVVCETDDGTGANIVSLGAF